MSLGSLPRPRSSRGPRRSPCRPALESFDVLLDLPMDIHVLGEVPIEIGKLRIDAIESLVDVGLRRHLAADLGDVALHRSDRFQYVFERGLGHALQATGARRERARKTADERPGKGTAGVTDIAKGRR